MAEDSDILVLTVGDEPPALKGQAAINLWLEGREGWNKWVKNNPKAEIDFSKVDFSQYRDHPSLSEEEWPFENFNFPEGTISFNKTKFGDGDISFDNSHFGLGDVSFIGTEFGCGDVRFIGAHFGVGNIVFNGAQFGTGDVLFYQTQFGDGGVYFIGAEFGIGNVSFAGVVFGDGEAIFRHAKFAKGNVNFRGAQFGLGDVSFHRSRFGEGTYIFENVVFNGQADFSELENTNQVTEFTFQHSSFNRSLEISSNQSFGCIVDLTRTKTTHQVSLDGLKVTLKRAGWLNKAADPKDIERARRLKELAENNKDHKAALDFHVLEMQAARWHQTKFWPGIVFEFLFWLLGDYGRSEIRPILWMIGALFGFGLLYWHKATEFTATFWNSLIFSAGQMFSLIPSSRDARSDGAKALFGDGAMPEFVYALTFTQSLFSIILLFLLGLALRNRFRV